MKTRLARAMRAAVARHFQVDEEPVLMTAFPFRIPDLASRGQVHAMANIQEANAQSLVKVVQSAGQPKDELSSLSLYVGSLDLPDGSFRTEDSMPVFFVNVLYNGAAEVQESK